MTRFRRFSLRALLLVFTVAAILLGTLGYQIRAAKEQAAALIQIEALGGTPLRITMRDGAAYNTISRVPAPRFGWLHTLLGEDYFVYVPYINLRSESVSRDSIRAMVPYIKQIRPKEGLNEAGKSFIVVDVAGNPNVDDAFVESIRSELPQCQISSPAPKPKGPYDF